MEKTKKNNTNRFKTLVLICVGVLMVFVVSANAATTMPTFNLPDARSGKNITNEKFQGKALLVIFFATWCAPCLQEVPNLIKLQKEFGKDKFSVLALSVDQGGRSVVQKLIKKYSINYPVLMANSETGKAFGGVRSIPVSFLINKEGNLVKKYRLGFIPHKEFQADIKSVLN